MENNKKKINWRRAQPFDVNTESLTEPGDILPQRYGVYIDEDGEEMEFYPQGWEF